MKKNLFILFLFISFIHMKAQYGFIDGVLTRLEERKGINQNLGNCSLEDKKFINIKDFEDHIERKFIIIKGNNSTYVEIFDDIKTNNSTSNVFTGDFVRTKKNIISIRVDLLEGKKIQIPITKTLMMTKQLDVLYLLDINTNERWIDEVSLIEDQKKTQKLLKKKSSKK